MLEVVAEARTLTVSMAEAQVVTLFPLTRPTLTSMRIQQADKATRQVHLRGDPRHNSSPVHTTPAPQRMKLIADINNTSTPTVNNGIVSKGGRGP